MTENENMTSVEKEQQAIEEQVATEAETGSDRQCRFRSWALWVSVAGAIWTILSAFGLTVKIGIEEGTFKTVLDAVGVILTGFGIVNNPTSKNSF